MEITRNKEMTATYCPEDDKLRLYVGRVSKEEYHKLRGDGWLCLHKQRESGGGDFAAVWTPSREDTALKYSDGIIEDEDKGPDERAADRAERFSGYRDKREGEAYNHADKYDNGPAIHGYQSQALAERRAARHDMIATRAVNAWDKAEYWQRRTAGVISHALHIAAPGVRMGRIKKLESELRAIEKSHADRRQKWEWWNNCANEQDIEKQNAIALKLAYIEHGDYTHPRTGRTSYLYSLAVYEEGREIDPLTGAELCALWLSVNPEPSKIPTGRWHNHITLRIAYENQMLEAQGGRLAHVDIVAGGWIGNKQIQKVNRSSATGRVTSVQVWSTRRAFTKESGYKIEETRPCLVTIDTERLEPGLYRPPTDDELVIFEAEKKAAKKEKAATTPKAPPLINPTDEEAERLQAIWNEIALQDHCKRFLKAYGKDYAKEFKPSTVCRITQAVYSANSKGNYARAETREICASGIIKPKSINIWDSKRDEYIKSLGPVLCQLRTTSCNGSDYGAKRVIILTDKPQKPLPSAIWAERLEEVAA